MSIRKFYELFLTTFYCVSFTFFRRKLFKFLTLDEPGLAAQKAYENEYPESTKIRYLHFLQDGVSIIAEQDSKIIGMAISSIITRNMKEQVFTLENQGHRNVLKVVNSVLDFKEFFAKNLEIDTVLDIMILGVDSACQGKKIGTRLIEESIKVGRTKGCQAVALVATNPKTAKIAGNLKMNIFKTVQWEDYGFEHAMPCTPVQSFYKYL